MKGWWQRLKVRWGIATDGRLAKIWVVFAITGSLSGVVGRQLLQWVGLVDLPPVALVLVRIAFVLVFYPLLLLTLGTLAGERRWFLWFLKRLYRISRHAPPPTKR